MVKPSPFWRCDTKRKSATTKSRNSAPSRRSWVDAASVENLMRTTASKVRRLCQIEGCGAHRWNAGQELYDARPAQLLCDPVQSPVRNPAIDSRRPRHNGQDLRQQQGSDPKNAMRNQRVLASHIPVFGIWDTLKSKMIARSVESIGVADGARTHDNRNHNPYFIIFARVE